eukprot:GHUV01029053.1.p1 GENE.GHUV01029053.1~~GHUV01029053.1.p1  ORF type:complete len:122 (-),score=17.03 GHUV01029053.1:783-1148(-)
MGVGLTAAVDVVCHLTTGLHNSSSAGLPQLGCADVPKQQPVPDFITRRWLLSCSTVNMQGLTANYQRLTVLSENPITLYSSNGATFWRQDIASYAQNERYIFLQHVQLCRRSYLPSLKTPQ